MSHPSDRRPPSVDQLTKQLDYLHVSTGASSLDENSTVNEFTQRPSAPAPHQRSWTGDQSAAGQSKRPIASVNPTANPQPLLQFVPTAGPTSQLPPSSGLGAALISPQSPTPAYFYQQGYYGTPSTAYSAYQQYPQWPMTNINFMPNLFVMTNAGPSHGYAVPQAVMPPPLLKTSFPMNSQRRGPRFPGGYPPRSFNSTNPNRDQPGSSSTRRQCTKTALCRNIENFNECMYGDRCYFAHNADELKPKPANIKYKTVLCTSLSQRGFCAFGEKCHFIHPLEDDQSFLPDPQRR